MRYAFTLVHHVGDDGDAPEGRILHTSNARFEDLERAGLVREATAEEVEAGYTPTFEHDTTTAPEVAPEAEAEQGDQAATPSEGGEKEAPEPQNKAAPRSRTKAA